VLFQYRFRLRGVSRNPTHGSFTALAFRRTVDTGDVNREFLSYYLELLSAHPSINRCMISTTLLLASCLSLEAGFRPAGLRSCPSTTNGWDPLSYPVPPSVLNCEVARLLCDETEAVPLCIKLMQEVVTTV
jgi:hypothetical protein